MRLKLILFVMFLTLQCVYLDGVQSAELPVRFKPVEGLNISALRLVDGADDVVDFQISGADFYVVNLWATWCTPCVAELPSLQALQIALDLQGENVDIIAISVDRKQDWTGLRQFFDRHGVTVLQPYQDQAKSFQRILKPASMPMTYLVRKNGDVIAVYERPAKWDDGQVVDEIISWKNKD